MPQTLISSGEEQDVDKINTTVSAATKSTAHILNDPESMVLNNSIYSNCLNLKDVNIIS